MKRLIVILGVLFAVTLTILPAAGQNALGTRNANVSMTFQPATSLSWILPSLSYYNASAASGGIGLRNQRNGTITISGVTTPMQAAYVYWAVITYTTTIPTPVKGLTVTRLWPTVAGVPAAQAVVGTLIGTGASPCWAGAQILVYRAALNTSTVALGNGVYKIQLKVNASGKTDGADPWAGTTFPLFEGASLVFVGTGTSKVYLFDQSISGYNRLAGQTFSTSLDYRLWLNGYTVTSKAIWHNIGADGQLGTSVLDATGSAQELTTINGTPHAGPGCTNLDSDWNGSSARPLPQLWDDMAHNITAISTGAGEIDVAFTSYLDCLTPVANVVEFQ
jgi:hypothetical protein